MAKYEDALVPRAYIGESIGRPSDQLGSYLDDLLKRNIIERTDRGVYRYVEPLLRLYVQKLPVLDPALSSHDTEELND